MTTSYLSSILELSLKENENVLNVQGWMNPAICPKVQEIHSLEDNYKRKSLTFCKNHTIPVAFKFIFLCKLWFLQTWEAWRNRMKRDDLPLILILSISWATDWSTKLDLIREFIYTTASICWKGKKLWIILSALTQSFTMLFVRKNQDLWAATPDRNNWFQRI